tara:strand:- start:204 stop:998 length:795 start_codon:yes stop_codon:yes gene_type:complete
MNVEEAVRRLNGYLQRRGKVDGSGGWTEQWLLDILTDANLDFYHRIVQYGPEIFHKTSRFTYTKDLESVVLRDKLGVRPMAIWYAGTLVSDADVSHNNMPIQLSMPRRTDIDVSTSSGGVSSNTGFSGSVAFGGGSASPTTIAIPGFNLRNASGEIQAFYLGEDFSLRPLPREDIYVYMRWTPAELPALVDPLDELLEGQLPQFHNGIVIKAAIAAKSAKGEDIAYLDRLYAEIIGPHDSNLKMGARSRQRQQPPQREPMRWEH